jgi:aminocarboxymuconate-semialdehyde decarboxylase
MAKTSAKIFKRFDLDDPKLLATASIPGVKAPPGAGANDYGLQNADGRITDAMVAVARLICKGHVARYRNIKFIAPMGSAGLPFLIGRLRRNYELTPGLGDPVEALGRIYTDTVLHDPRVLRFVIEIVGAERVMMGSDQPFPI